ncbi:MAG: zinc-binding dehydrogenase [Candidatus Hydrogenedentes bacterium]|nr:zinc-binding dehydrogenase [Candidatus Hydrogenedentota bacterium]
MKALQITRPGHIEIIDAPVPEPASDQVLIRVLAVTTCPHWDMHIFNGVPMFPGFELTYPYTLGQPGHEACGEIAAVGSAVTDLRAGQRVCMWRDQGHHRPGCYAEFVVADAANVIVVPEALAPEACASLELAMCVSAHVMYAERLDAIAGKRVGVFGLGPAGLVCVQLARAAGAEEIIGFDPLPDRRTLAETLGADKAFDSASAEATGFSWRGAPGALHTAFDCVGKPDVVHHAMDVTSHLVVLFAVQREPYVFSPHHWAGLTVAGTQPHTRQAAEYALARLKTGSLDLRCLVTHTMSLSEYPRAVELLTKGQALKVAFVVNFGTCRD